MLPLLSLRTATAFAAAAIGTVASAGLDLATRPARTTAKVLSGSSRSSDGDGRAWITVPGLSGPDGAERGRAVVDALRGQPAVVSARLNRPLSRVVVEFDGDAISQDELCSVVADAGNRCTAAIGQPPSSAGALPGDGLLLAARGQWWPSTPPGLASRFRAGCCGCRRHRSPSMR